VKVDFPGENVCKIHNQGVLFSQLVHGLEEAGRDFAGDPGEILIYRDFLFDGHPFSARGPGKLVGVERTGGIEEVQKLSLGTQSDFEGISGLDPAEIDHRLQMPAYGFDQVFGKVLSPQG
jgi:hypothetical protein